MSATSIATPAPLASGALSADSVRPAFFQEHLAVGEDVAAADVLAASSTTVSAFRLLRSFYPRLLPAALFAALLVVAAGWPALLVSGDPLAADARQAFQAPSAAHVLGTDENGRDVLTRIVYGVRPTLFVGLAATGLGLSLGLSVGLAAGLGPRSLDGVLMRGVDALLAVPDLLFALVIITFCGPGMSNAIVAIGVASATRYARLVRAQTQSVRHAAFVEAAVTLGLRRSTVIFRHVLPNVIKPVLIFATVSLGMKIGAAAALSFLGVGTPPPAPEWGSMLSVGRNFLANAWWLTAVPAAAVTFTVISLSTLGRELLRRSEGKNRHS